VVALQYKNHLIPEIIRSCSNCQLLFIPCHAALFLPLGVGLT